jgi:hypothetical protein
VAVAQRVASRPTVPTLGGRTTATLAASTEGEDPRQALQGQSPHPQQQQVTNRRVKEGTPARYMSGMSDAKRALEKQALASGEVEAFVENLARAGPQQLLDPTNFHSLTSGRGGVAAAADGGDAATAPAASAPAAPTVANMKRQLTETTRQGGVGGCHALKIPGSSKTKLFGALVLPQTAVSVTLGTDIPVGRPFHGSPFRGSPSAAAARALSSRAFSDRGACDCHAAPTPLGFQAPDPRYCASTPPLFLGPYPSFLDFHFLVVFILFAIPPSEPPSVFIFHIFNNFI